MASRFPFALSFEPFVKNETVKGIIGKTHGVSNAINPPKNPRSRYVQKFSLFFCLATPQSVNGFSWSMEEIFNPSCFA